MFLLMTLFALLVGLWVHAPEVVVISLMIVSPFLMAALLAAISQGPRE
jgi:hypothetical protein